MTKRQSTQFASGLTAYWDWIPVGEGECEREYQGTAHACATLGGLHLDVVFLDYLHKPRDPARHAQTVERTAATLAHRKRLAYGAALCDYGDAHDTLRLEHIDIRSVGRIEQVRVDDILWIESVGHYIELHPASRAAPVLIHDDPVKPENILMPRLSPSQYLTIALACLSLAPLTSRAADPAQMRKAVDRAVLPVMARYQIPGMAIAITVNGQTTFFNYGIASRENKTPVSEHSLFELGSVSKTFTATLVCYAQVRGMLSLQDHPGKYIARLKSSAINQASLLDLGTFTAGGLPLQVPDDVTSDEEMLAYLSNWSPEFAPGTWRRYSNPSIGLLGRVTALALNTNFSDAIEQQLFPALGLRQSYIRVPDSAMVNYAWGYDRKNKPVRVRPGVFDAEAYGVKSSTADVIRFVHENMQPDSLAEPIRRAVECTHVGFFKIGDMVQGLGWEQYRQPVTLQRLLVGNSDKMSGDGNPAQKLAPPQLAPRKTFFNKTGSTGGFGAYVAFMPDRGTGIVMLANKNYPIQARVQAAYAILEQLGPTVSQDPANRSTD